MSLFKAFSYTQKDTLIHRLDPRSKLFFVIVFTLLSLIYVEIEIEIFLLLITLLLLSIARSLMEWLTTIKFLSLMIILIFIFNFIYTSLYFAISMVLRLLILTATFSIFFLTVHPDDLYQALIQMKIPFHYAFAFSMAVRFVPTLALEARTIMEAQMSKGLELEKGGLFKKAKNFIPILAPLVVNSIRRAIQIAESLESRGFGAVANRTSLYQLHIRPIDYLFIFLTIMVSVALLLLNYTSLSISCL